MIWEKPVLLGWFIRGLVSVNCFFSFFFSFLFSFLNFYSLTVLFVFQERGFFFLFVYLTL